jgi:hypothetical protein
MAPPKKIGNVLIEDARILFRNFAGEEGQYNAAGKRNFNVILPDDVAEQMLADGWNVKYLQPREGEEDATPTPRLEVSVGYKVRPPTIVLLTSKGQTRLGEADVNILDWADIEKADLIIRPYEWDVNGKTGIKAYVQTLYVTIREDELELKYANVPDSAQSAMVQEPEETEE